MSAKLLLAGYFGCGNLGDDAILLGFVQGIKEHPYTFRTLCGSPEELMRHYGLQGVQRLDSGAIKAAIAESDAVVFPGGSIFQDVTSVRSVAYYMGVCRQAKRSGKKLILLGQGVGPLRRFLGKRFAAAAFNHADAIVVRDQESVRTLKALGVRTTPRMGGDMAYLLPRPERLEEAQAFGVGNIKSVAISARPFKRDKNRAVVALFSETAKLLHSQGYLPVLFEMDRLEDGPIIQEISKHLGGKVPEIRNLTTPIQAQERLGRMEGVIAMRLHAGILATTVGVPPFMINYDPKVGAFVDQLGFPGSPAMANLTAGRILEGFRAFMEERERYAAQMERRREELTRLARANIEVLSNCLGA